MVVERRSQKHAMRLRILQPMAAPAVLEHEPLQDHAHHFADEYAADHQQKELALEQNRHRAERTAERERARVAHEDLRRERVEPQEADARAEHGGAEDGELPGPAHVKDEQVRARVDATEQVGEDPERAGRDRDEPRRESVEAVRDVDRVARAGEHERHPRHVQPGERRARRCDEHVLEERQRRRCAG